jgi:lipopolysaccharide biosynthesis regulator YciM
VLALLQAHYAQGPSLDVLDAIVALSERAGAAPADQGESRMWYLRHLEHEPSLVAAAKWLAGERLEHEEFHPQIQAALDTAARPLTRYRCAACGFEARQHFCAWTALPGCSAMLVLGIGALVVLYARYYMSPADPVPRFFSFCWPSWARCWAWCCRAT